MAKKKINLNKSQGENYDNQPKEKDNVKPAIMPDKEETVKELFNSKIIHQDPKPFNKVKLSQSWGKK